jgi:nitrile hydratase accessory protein
VKPPRPFDEPWESRAFGVAVALSDRGVLDFEAFRAALIAEIEGAGPSSYYEQWQAALERVLAESGLVSRGELAARAQQHQSATRSSHSH